MPEPETALRCVCGDPVERWTGPGEPGWVHTPGSDTRCLDARPRCPHCGLPHDLDPAGLPARVCAMARTPEYRASIKAIPPDYQPAPTTPAPGLREQIAGVFRAVDGKAPAWTKRDAGPEAHVDAVMAVVQPVIDEAQQRAEQAEAMTAEVTETLRRANRELDAAATKWDDDLITRTADLTTRAETAEAALVRVREVCDQLQRASVLADGQPHTDREHGVVQAVARVRTALTPPAPADQTEGEGA